MCTWFTSVNNRPARHHVEFCSFHNQLFILRASALDRLMSEESVPHGQNLTMSHAAAATNYGVRCGMPVVHLELVKVEGHVAGVLRQRVSADLGSRARFKQLLMT